MKKKTIRERKRRKTCIVKKEEIEIRLNDKIKKNISDAFTLRNGVLRSGYRSMTHRSVY